MPLWVGPAAAVVATLAVGALAFMTLFGGDDGDVVVVGSPDNGGIENPLAGAGIAGDGIADDPAVDGAAEEPIGAADPEDEAGAQEPGDAGDDAAAGSEDDAEADEPEVPEVDTTISENPLTIALMVSNAEELTPQEVSLTGMLEGNGHTVRPFTVTAEPIVNAVNNPRIDVLLFSPSFEFSLLYYPSAPNSLPMLDMARYSWYRRYMVPWGDEVVGRRFSGRGETTVMAYYEDDGVIDWEGQEVGPVQLLTGERFSGEAPMKEAMDHSTNGAAQYFLRHVTDNEGESTLGVYVPAGSTITLPAPTLAEEQRFTSVAPWIGLLLFTDDPGDGNQYLEMTPAGENLIEASLQHLVGG
ncbi:MAG: hypothetical protein ACE367_18165 [Acidimicrobiales bacterium]